MSKVGSPDGLVCLWRFGSVLGRGPHVRWALEDEVMVGRLARLLSYDWPPTYSSLSKAFKMSSLIATGVAIFWVLLSSFCYGCVTERDASASAPQLAKTRPADALGSFRPAATTFLSAAERSMTAGIALI